MQTSIILTYKNKVLMFSKEDLLNPNENVWDILYYNNLKESKIVEKLKIDMNISKEKNDPENQIIKLNNSDNNLTVYLVRMSDANVNSIKRKNGWRIEFYRTDELGNISLSQSTREIFNTYSANIETYLTA